MLFFQRFKFFRQIILCLMLQVAQTTSVRIHRKTGMCEHTGQMTLNCSNDEVISITNASWGNSPEIARETGCGSTGYEVSKCKIVNVNAEVSQLCAASTVPGCGFPTNRLYLSLGDPCPNVLKYLSVSYTCVAISNQPQLSSECPSSEWIPYENSCYYFELGKKMTAKDAQLDCRSRGGSKSNLASILDANENTFIGNRIRAVPAHPPGELARFWIGLVRKPPAGHPIAGYPEEGFHLLSKRNIIFPDRPCLRPFPMIDHSHFIDIKQQEAIQKAKMLQTLQRAFKWLDGSRNEYLSWAIHEPNDHQSIGEFCVEAVIEGNQLKWNDLVCGNLLRYVCKVQKATLTAPAIPSTTLSSSTTSPSTPSTTLSTTLSSTLPSTLSTTPSTATSAKPSISTTLPTTLRLTPLTSVPKKAIAQSTNLFHSAVMTNASLPRFQSGVQDSSREANDEKAAGHITAVVVTLTLTSLAVAIIVVTIWMRKKKFSKKGRGSVENLVIEYKSSEVIEAELT